MVRSIVTTVDSRSHRSRTVGDTAATGVRPQTTPGSHGRIFPPRTGMGRWLHANSHRVARGKGQREREVEARFEVIGRPSCDSGFARSHWPPSPVTRYSSWVRVRSARVLSYSVASPLNRPLA